MRTTVMKMRTAVADDEIPGPVQCWCCGSVDAPDKLVRLGNHPEVAVCVRCAHFLSKSAREIEDRARSGLLVHAREGFRRLRKTVVRHGWHHNKIVGRGLRWVGRFTP
jgi:hypothetical protein